MMMVSGNCKLDFIHDPKDEADVDIVFMHGLKEIGNVETTWTFTSSEGSWPNVLRQKIPRARISVVQYDASIVAIWESKVYIKELSNNLIKHLKDMGRPIIFIAYSLCGLICAQALVSANEVQSPIASHTCGIMFFGTPHDGGNTAEWVERGRLFLKYLGIADSDHLVRNCDHLSNLGQRFPAMLDDWARSGQKISILCLFEGKEVTTPYDENDFSEKFKVVPEKAACLEGYPKYEISREHNELCQFEGKEDRSYVHVCGVLEGWVKELSPQSASEVAVINNVRVDYGGTYYGGAQIAQFNGSPSFAGDTYHIYECTHRK